MSQTHTTDIDSALDVDDSLPFTEKVRVGHDLTIIAGQGTETASSPGVLARLAAVVDTAGVALIATDLDGCVTHWNQAAQKLYGYSSAEMVGRHASLAVPAPQKHLVTSTIAALLRGEERTNVETTHWRADGARIDVALDFALIRDDLGNPIGVSAAARDITDERRIDEIVKRERDLLRTLVAIQQELAAASDRPLDDVMQLVCNRTQDLTGAEGTAILVPDGDQMSLRSACGTLSFFVGTEIPVDGSLVGECLDTKSIIYCHDTKKSSRVHRITKETLGVRSMLVVPLHGRDGIVGVLNVVSSKPGGVDELVADSLRIVAGFFADTLDRAARAEVERALRAELAALAVTDGLTGLKNHRFLQERLAEEVNRAHRNGTALCAIMLDVDSFKEYNDSFGHPAGDHILRGIADILTANARATDLVARYGGEEFALLLPHADIAGATALAERIRTQIETADWPLRRVTASLGVTQLVDTDTPASLHDRADTALNRAKAAGRYTVSAT